jgi:hypothetical protein
MSPAPRSQFLLPTQWSGFGNCFLHLLKVLGVSSLTWAFNGEKDAGSCGGQPSLRRNLRTGEKRMRKTGVAISAIVLGLAIGSTGVASAKPRAVGECSPAFVGMDIQTVIDTIAAPGFDPQAFHDEDRNGDNRLCIKIIPNEGGPPQFDPAFVFIDNKI